jgi:AcrR family transcriptional regulator
LQWKKISSCSEEWDVAYEVIKRVSGRAYRYRVESYRDPETRRVRGKWTYLGRVEGEGTLSPERKARPSSRDRLLDAVERLLETNELASISTGMVASEAGLAYGTFYRHFRDLAHVVRDAMVRETANLEALNEYFSDEPGDLASERSKMMAWVRATIAAVLARPGLSRAWHVTSNHDSAVVAERQRRFEANVDHMAQYLERLQAAGRAKPTPAFAAYAIIALVGAAAREAAIDNAFSEAKHAGIISVVTDLAGL